MTLSPMPKLLVGLALVSSGLLLTACGSQTSHESSKAQLVAKSSSTSSSHRASHSASASSDDSIDDLGASSTSKASSTSTSSESAATSSADGDYKAPHGSTANKVTDKTIGVMVAFKEEPDWFKQYLADGTMAYGVHHSDDPSDDTDGYSYVTANGSLLSYLFYKVDGDQVTIKIPTDYDGSGETKTTTVSALKDDYYQTPSQRSEVNGAADLLKSSDY